MKFFNLQNTIILNSIFLLSLIIAFFLNDKNDSFNTFMTITSIVAVAVILSMDIYDYYKSKS